MGKSESIIPISYIELTMSKFQNVKTKPKIRFTVTPAKTLRNRQGQSSAHYELEYYVHARSQGAKLPDRY